jgi:cytochrome P450
MNTMTRLRRRYPGEFLYKLMRRPLPFLLDTARLGSVHAFGLGKVQVALVNRPDLIHQVLVTDAANYAKGRGLETAQRLLGHGLLTSENPLHKSQRQLLQPIFQPRNLARFESEVDEKTRQLLEHWPAEGEIDASREMTRLTLEIITQSLFGTDVDVSEVREAMGEALEVFRTASLPLYELAERIFPPLRSKPLRVRRRLDSVLHKMLEQKHSLLQQCPMSAEQLRDEAMTMFLAGHETTAHALTFALYLLSRHPQQQERARQDQDYLKWVILETLRLYPTAWMIGRRSREESSLGEYHLPAGTTVLMSPYVAHRNSEFFPDPEEFRPERWLERPRTSLPRGVFFPFGAGPRVCIGEHFAWMEMERGLRLILSGYRLGRCPVEKPRLRPGITLGPDEALRIPIERI